MKRMIVITNALYPNGNAAANYVENICKTILAFDDGYKIHIIAPESDHGNEDNNQRNLFDVKHVKYKKKKNIYIDFFDLFRILKLINYKSKEETIYFLYGLDVPCYLLVFYLAKMYHSKIVVCYAERFDKDYFPDGIRGKVAFLRSELRNNLVMPLGQNAITVSRYLYIICKQNGMNALILPPVIDIKKHRYLKKDFKNTEVYRILYSGCDVKKDRIDNILKAVSLLPSQYLDRVELHFTGITKEKLYSLVDKEVFNTIEHRLVVHKWLQWTDYMDLLDSVDFGIILRDKNRTTLANFPSKIPEFMAHGIIPIVSDVGDFTRYYLKDGHDSFYVKSSMPQECSEKVIQIMNMPKEVLSCMRDNSRKTAQCKFDYTVWISKMNSFMDAL